jgi:HAD superfamily phosphoserine phosphatase-like hydrolase
MNPRRNRSPSDIWPPLKLLTFDIDGTLTRGHGWAWIAKARGRQEAYERTTRLFRSGRIGEDRHLANLLNLAEGLTVRRLRQLLTETPKIGGLQRTVSHLHRRGIRVALLTHNPDLVCRWYQETYGFDDWEGTRLPVREGRIRRVRTARADKRRGLVRLLARAGVDPEEAVHVGDSRADLALRDYLSAFVALNARDPAVRREADGSLRTDRLDDLLPLLERVRRRPRRRLRMTAPFRRGRS